jgi:hypothetical protein
MEITPSTISMFSRLASKLTHLFNPTVISRGEGYFARGSVRIVRAAADTLDAQVSGSELYEAQIEWEDGELSLYCSCPYFKSDGPCKHLWAAVLAAQERGYLSKIAAIRKVSHSAFAYPDGALTGPPVQSQRNGRWLPPVAKVADWKSRIADVGNNKHPLSHSVWPANRQIVYIVELAGSVATGHPVVSLCSRDRKANGSYGRISPLKLQRSEISTLPLSEDREILSAMTGGTQYYGYGGYMDSQYGPVSATSLLRHPLSKTVIPMLARTGRCYLRESTSPEVLEPLGWDGGGTWRFELEMRANGKSPRDAAQSWLVAGVLRRGDETVEASTPELVTQGGNVFVHGMAAPLAEGPGFDWLVHLRQAGSIHVPAKDCDELLSTLLCAPGLPRLEVPAPLRYEEVTIPPRPCLRIRAEDRRRSNSRLGAELSFEYEGRIVPALDKSRGIYDAAARRFAHRDTAAEQSAMDLLAETGIKFRAPNWYEPEPGWDLAPAKLPQVVRTLLAAGWHLDIDGKVFRRPGAFRMEVSSGVDWFELHGEVEYGEATARLPELLAALRRGESTVKLSDGSFGVLPEELLRRIGMLAGMGTTEDGHIRFRQSQAGLLDALLAAQPEATFDKGFGLIRDEMRRFQSVEAAAQPEGFVGHLRDYQREGVGWMDFLRRFSFGGCLADDMGVGKTAQVLAMLESRRESPCNNPTSKGQRVSLVVVPRSLLFNWKQEAERFTPQLRVLDYTGLNRIGGDFAPYDLILTTYGTLRRDAVRLKDFRFDYVVLDESQAVKNAGTESAKAVRLLQGDHRLALSGTPVENHLGELWSLFEFLNPGMLGAASVFKAATGAGRVIDEDTRKLLSQALRPFILRRTKDQVARELPAKTEQTIYCELKPAQRKLYDELRQHYRDSLLQRIETEGLAKSKIMVLEALLRLRQAACHPGLIDIKRSGEPSAKLDSLLEQLREVLDAGHKALVFSQFTSLLKIVRDRLDADGVVYEYLDGKTRNRQACVERFQNDADCKLFLVSLKAGGLGLNLTAAEYVFLLDPWWNPAVEAQAVDRAHRIGQTKPVFAYRLIARDTVEEKVLELQKTKRDLAAAIIGQDNALIRNLRREDLELLLS